MRRSPGPIEDHPEERAKVRRAGWQHERHRLASADALLLQSTRDGQASLVQLGVGKRVGASAIAHRNLHPIGVPGQVPL